MNSKLDIIKTPGSLSSITVTDSNINTGVLAKHAKLINTAFLWHKIIVHNVGSETRDEILKIITDSVHPMDLIPVYYQTDGVNAHFLVRNCGNAIEDFGRKNLVVQNPNNPQKPFKISIVLAYSSTNELKINVQDNILSVLEKRYSADTKTLNLDNFYKDPGLNEFCMLAQPKILYFVLHLSKGLKFQTLKLTNNDIKLVNPIHALIGNAISVLDLRNNLIEDIDELSNLKNFNITELWLEGNPLCSKYDEFSYVQAIQDICPKIEKLDGFHLGPKGFPTFRRNFLNDPDNLALADQFVEHFFTLYDSNNRGVLEKLYHKNAMFSITAHYLQGQLSSPTAQLSKYIRLSRNLKSLADFSRVGQLLKTGNSTIIKILNELPPTEHDPYTFTVDVMHSTDKITVIIVGGVFRERSMSLLEQERHLGFSRLFVLQAAPNGEYNIINEILNVTNATTSQQTRAFKVNRPSKLIQFTLQPAVDLEDQREMAETLALITTLNLDWAKKCLDESGYDLQKALQLFVDLYKVDRIPENAFKK